MASDGCMELGGVKGWMGAEKLGALGPLASQEVPVSGKQQAAPAPGRWPEARVAAVEALWGAGFIAPGGAPEAIRLAKPLGLSNKATLLLVGGGIGGPARAISGNFGTWVASFEAEPALSALAVERRAVVDESSSRVTVAGWDRAAPTFQPRSANHALSLEALRGTHAAPLIAGIAKALRPQGQIVMTELVADERPKDQDREFSAWCRLENRLPDLPSPDEVSAEFGRQQFDVRVVEDISDRHVTQTLSGWRDAVRGMASGPKPVASQAAAFVTEAELWLLRIRLMRRLGFRLMRWHAIAAA